MSDGSNNDDQQPEGNKLATYISFGVTFGLLFGVVLGLTILDNIALGVAMGPSLGIIGGVLLFLTTNRSSEDEQE